MTTQNNESLEVIPMRKLLRMKIVEFFQKWTNLQTESTQKIDELTAKLQECQQELSEAVRLAFGLRGFLVLVGFLQGERLKEFTDLQEKQRQELIDLEKEKNETIEDLK